MPCPNFIKRLIESILNGFSKKIKLIICLSLLAQVSGFAESPVEISIDHRHKKTITAATKIGINLEMALTSDAMWGADNRWMERTFSFAGIKSMRWGYSASWWDAIRERPLTEFYWSGSNTKDSAGSFGLTQFMDYCLRTKTTPFIMLPVDSLPAGVSMDRMLELSREMMLLIASKPWETPVYIEMGNEPYYKPLVPKEQYAEAVKKLYPLGKSISDKFRMVAQIHGTNGYHPFITNSCKDYYDVIGWHYYLPCGGSGKDPWKWYQQLDSDHLLEKCEGYFPVEVPGGKEFVIGEINVLWPGWGDGMAADRKSSLAYLNLLLSVISSNRASHILPWPSHWPGSEGKSDYGMFSYTDFTKKKKPTVFPSVTGAHKLMDEHVRPVQLSAASTDPGVRVFAYEEKAGEKDHLILINKNSDGRKIRIAKNNISSAEVWQLSGRTLEDRQAEYRPLESIRLEGGRLEVDVPAESAVGMALSLK